MTVHPAIQSPGSLASRPDAEVDAAEPDDVADHRRWRWRRWLAAALAIVLLAGLTWVVVSSPVLAVRSVTVEGTSRLSATQVRSAAEVPLGVPLVRVSRSAIRTRVEQLPEVRSARVELSFPSTVVIAVTERVAAAYGLAPSGHFTYLDTTGRTFGQLSAAPTGLPLLAPAANVAADTPTLAAMAQVAAALPTAIATQVKQLTATSADLIDLQFRDGRVVVWGGSDRNADKARILPTLLHRPGNLIDISNPDVVFTH